jgi:hypothetical protein
MFNVADPFTECNKGEQESVTNLCYQRQLIYQRGMPIITRAIAKFADT